MFRDVGSVVGDSPEGLENPHQLQILVKDETHTNEATSPTVRECTGDPYRWGSLPEVLRGKEELDQFWEERCLELGLGK